ncbi:MAG: hypothetical protein QM662_08590 [Gordonia sp. (in: high G+C Gram-positive bacteria)]
MTIDPDGFLYSKRPHAAAPPWMWKTYRAYRARIAAEDHAWWTDTEARARRIAGRGSRCH